MPARAIPLVTGQYYHLFNRGINRQTIFSGVRDYSRVVGTMEFYSFAKPPIRFSKFLLLDNERKNQLWSELRQKNDKLLELIAFCFMPNHFHFLVRPKKDNGISKFMANFQNSYVRYFNTKHGKIGPIFQGQFKAIRIETEEQLLHLSRYIHLNPYSSYVLKKVGDLENYQWSSLPEYLGILTSTICNKEIILSNFKKSGGYKRFVFDQADYQRELEKIKHLTFEG